MSELSCVEICAGAGGQALGLERAGFHHSVLVEIEPEYCKVLKHNRPGWNVVCADAKDFGGRTYKGADLLAGGVPCPPFSSAGRQLGRNDERDLFPEALRLVREIMPRAVMLENVRGFLDKKFDAYRTEIFNAIESQGYGEALRDLVSAGGWEARRNTEVRTLGLRGRAENASKIAGIS